MNFPSVRAGAFASLRLLFRPRRVYALPSGSSRRRKRGRAGLTEKESTK